MKAANLRMLLLLNMGITVSPIARWVKQYSEVKIDDGTILTARQIQQLQKRNTQLEEENLI